MEPGLHRDCRRPNGAPHWADSAKDCVAAVNLVGEGIFNRRWSAAFRQILYASRVQSTENIVAALVKSPATKILVNASAIGYYGSTGDEELTEASPPGSDFLARLCVDWKKPPCPLLLKESAP